MGHSEEAEHASNRHWKDENKTAKDEFDDMVAES